MKLKLALAAGILLVAAATAALLLKHDSTRHPANGPSTHASGIDHAEAAALAGMKAPEGKTPCETAFNAITAEQETAKAEGTPPLFKSVAAREPFLAHCGALPPETQLCLGPRYLARHRDECARARPSPEKLKELFEAAP